MTTLEEHLIEKIHPEVSPLWAVADGDGLFRNDAVDRLLGERGAEVVIYDDPMAFRYRYEHQIRPRLESADAGCHVIVLDPGPDGFYRLPADLYDLCQKLQVSLGDLFPSLSRRVLVEQEPAMLAKLWEKRDQLPATTLGDRDTADLVLRLGFRIETTFIGSFQDLVHILIDLHFSGRRLPKVLAKRIEEVVTWSEINSGDLRKIVRNPAEFWIFLQEQWERWVRPTADEGLAELSCPEVNFVEDRVRVWIDNLFLEGFLEPVPADQIKAALPQPWCQVGVTSKSSAIHSEELARQRQHLVETLPAGDANYQPWLKFAHAYSAHVAATFACDPGAADENGFWRDLWEPMNEHFQEFVKSRMESLGTLPPTRPTLVHHIAQFLARRVKAERKVALLVLDGLSLAQWKGVRSELDEQLTDILISDDACFTLVPSVTNICRQSIYAGELPVFFEPTIERTDLDPKRWKSFWDGSCGRPVRSAHHNVEGREGDLEMIRASLEGNSRALGMTIRMPDEIVHGATMGWRGVFGQLQLWIQSGFLRDLIQEVIASGFELYLTSDHGNIEAIGDGAPSQGVLVDRSGQRVRIYRNETILKQTEEELGPRARRWNGKLLPANYVPLIHQGRGAFTQQGKSLVCHGGSSLDELVVPFIQFSADTES